MNRLLLGAAPLALALGLAACAGSTQARVAALESGLTAAETAALSYASLPRCPAATAVCSDATKVQQIKVADSAAYVAVKSAEASGASGDVAAAEGALASLVALLPQFVTPNTGK